MRTLLSLLLTLCLLQLLAVTHSVDGLRSASASTLAALPQQQSFSARIVGGNEAALGDWPGIVSIQNRFGFPFCSGSIIDDRWVLTAGSCLSGLRAPNLLLLAGTTASWNLSAVGYYADKIYVHCNYDKPLYHNDIALIHLTTDVEYNDYIKKLPLAALDELQLQEPLNFAGWGAVEEEGSISVPLMQASGSYLDVPACRRALGNTENVDEGHVCVQLPQGQGMCYSDAGAPLINAQGQLVGIGNWGVPCGRGFPDVYSRVAFYHDWIRSTINGYALG
ncbi:chymotrypsin-2 [Drosophila busckii]|nr:chymotrypsin-2 [Drosophila busckii]